MKKLFATVLLFGSLIGFPAMANHASFVMVNNTGVAILEVRATSVYNPSFGQDLLGPSEVIRSQGSTFIDPKHNASECLFDLLITFDTGDRQAIRRVNLCQASTITTYGQQGSGFRHTVQ